MSDFKKIVEEVHHRGDVVSPILPGAGWIFVKGNFIPKELRAIATEVESNFAEMMRTNGNKN